MAESDREWLGEFFRAWRALKGDEDLSFVREYVSHANGLAREFATGRIRVDDKGTAEELMVLFQFLRALEASLANEDPAVFKVKFIRRKKGRGRGVSPERSKALNEAVAMVETAVEAGVKQEAAIADAMERTQLPRSDIFDRLSLARRERAEWAEHERLMAKYS